jgi:hypothetical protein
MTQYINLYDPSLRRDLPSFAAQHLAAATLALALAVGGTALVAAGQAREAKRQAAALAAQAQQEREALTRIGQQLAASRPSGALASQLAAAEAMLAQRREVLAALDGGVLGNTSGFSPYLRAFARQSLSGLWLTGLDIGAGGTQLALRGRALDAELLPRYIRKLNEEPALRGRSFAALRMSVGEPKPDGDAKGKTEAVVPPLQFMEFDLVGIAPAAGVKP